MGVGTPGLLRKVWRQSESVVDSRFVNGKQWHTLAPLGVSPDGNEWHAWCKPGVKRTGGYMRDYVKKVNENCGVVTIDVCLKRDGSIPREQIEVLKELPASPGK